MSGSVLVKIFSQEEKPGANPKKQLKNYENYEEIDVDAAILLEHFGDKAHFHRKMSVQEIKDTIQEIDSKYEVLVFVFLTYLSVKQTNNEELLDCCDKPMKLEEIFDLIKSKNLLIGKQKIFLVQADDLRLLHPDDVPKGPKPLPEPRKIPTDSDRLVIFSTLPQELSLQISSQDSKSSENEGQEGQPADKSPSMLIRAFVETLTEASTKDEDLLTQTTRINGKVYELIQQLKRTDTRYENSTDLQVPLVTSTLRKLVHITK